MSMNLIFWLSLALVILGIAEKARHRRFLRRIPIRILVNGTRGKTSVTRLLAAALNEAGIRTYAKCTGTLAVSIAPSGEQSLTKRKHGASMREMLSFVRLAARDKADAIVVECMAVQPDLQKVFSRGFVQPTLALITNARVDHTEEMGQSETETAAALASVIVPSASVIAADVFSPYTEKLVLPDASVSAEELEGFSYPVYADNLAMVFTALEQFRVPRSIALRGMRRAIPDLGMVGPFHIENAVVVNGFAANDAESSGVLLEHSVTDAKRWVFIYNHREDRMYRLQAFLPFFRAHAHCCERIYVIGDASKRIVRYMARKTGISCEKGGTDEAFIRNLCKAEKAILCLGNIRGAGEVWIGQCMRMEVGQPCCKVQLD